MGLNVNDEVAPQVQRVIYSAVAYFVLHTIVVVTRPGRRAMREGDRDFGAYVFDLLSLGVGASIFVCGYQGAKTSNKDCLCAYVLTNVCCGGYSALALLAMAEVFPHTYGNGRIWLLANMFLWGLTIIINFASVIFRRRRTQQPVV